MGVVGSLPLDNQDTQKEHSLSLPDKDINETVDIIPVVKNTCDNHTKVRRYCPYHHHSSITTSPETDLKEENIKHEFRQRNHRETTRRLKAKNNVRRQKLEKQIHELEVKQNTLLSDVANLNIYKQQLQIKCDQIHFVLKSIE